MEEITICAHPNLQPRGVIKEDGEEVLKVSLKDCLSCSGCAITNDDVILLSRQNHSAIIKEIEHHKGFVVLVSSIAVANLAAVIQRNPNQAFYLIQKYFLSVGASKVVIDTDVQLAWRQLLEKNIIPQIQKPVVIPRCAGSILFFERKTEYGSYLAPIKPYSQLFAQLEKRSGATYVIALSPCHDRKLETGRFENEIDAVLTLSEIYDYIDFEQDIPDDIPSIKFPYGTDVESLINKDYISKEINQKKIVEYSYDGYKSCFVSGMAAHKNVAKEKKFFEYQIIEADLCPYACCSGVGLSIGKTTRERQNLVDMTNQWHNNKDYTIKTSEEANKLFTMFSELKFQTEYKSEKKTEKPDFVEI